MKLIFHTSTVFRNQKATKKYTAKESRKEFLEFSYQDRNLQNFLFMFLQIQKYSVASRNMRRKFMEGELVFSFVNGKSEIRKFLNKKTYSS